MGMAEKFDPSRFKPQVYRHPTAEPVVPDDAVPPDETGCGKRYGDRYCAIPIGHDGPCGPEVDDLVDLLRAKWPSANWSDEIGEYLARRILVSDWLAERDAALTHAAAEVERERIAVAMGALGAHWNDCAFPDTACDCDLGLFEVRAEAARIARQGANQ